MKACWNNHLEIASLLIQHGANVDFHDQVEISRILRHSLQSNETALLKTCWQDHFDIVALLIEHGANVNTYNSVREI